MSSTGLARSGNLAATHRELSKLKELRAMLEKANQSYWAEQVETQMLTASAWIAHAKGQEDEARSNSCAPPQMWRITAKSTSPCSPSITTAPGLVVVIEGGPRTVGPFWLFFF